jgi:HD-GYP domain-containing protein (c-di-GMP phosphodiesterase class II)
VADVVEAISLHRPYRPALGIEVAIEEITSGAGTLYDGSVTRACLDLLKEGFSFE